MTMNVGHVRNILLGAMVLSMLPLHAFATSHDPVSSSTAATNALATTPPGFNVQGIFDCNKNGAYSSVGSTVAIGGPFVPVADYAVELNTGVLVYKECVLRNIVVRRREAAMTALLKKTNTAVQTGRNGNKQFVENQNQEKLNVSDLQEKAFRESSALDAVHPSFRSDVQRAVAINYQLETRAKESALECPFEGDISVYQKDPTHNFSWDAFFAMSKSTCIPFWAKMRAIEMRDEQIGRALAAQYDEWNWGRGYYAVTDNAANPLARKVLTPSVTVQASFQNIIDSPIRQLESANDIGQMIGALYAGLETQILADSRGLAGISVSTGGQLSYIDQLVANSSQGLRNAALNAALQILASARRVEAAYLQAATAISTSLAQASAQLRSAENQCWNLIIPQVCTSTALNAQNECTDASSTYKIATSTAGYAQAVIVSQITPLITVAATNTATSQAALARIDVLIKGVSQNASLEVQRTSLLELDALVAQHRIHTQPDVDGPNGIVKKLDSVQAAMNALVTDTVKSWADDPSPAVGWCNINNTAVIQAWKDTWKK